MVGEVDITVTVYVQPCLENANALLSDLCQHCVLFSSSIISYCTHEKEDKKSQDGNNCTSCTGGHQIHISSFIFSEIRKPCSPSIDQSINEIYHSLAKATEDRKVLSTLNI